MQDRDKAFKHVAGLTGPYDTEDPRSLINIIPKEFYKVIVKIPIDALTADEIELQASVKPSPRLNQIRLAFWKEYESAQATLSNMTVRGIMHFLSGMPSIHLGIAMNNPMQAAWLLCPPASYDNTLEEALQRGLSRVNELLSMPFHNADGRIDYQLIKLVLQATAFVDMRLNGRPVERIETRNTNTSLTVGVTKRDLPAVGGGNRVQELDYRIKELEAQLAGNAIKKIDG